MKTLLGCMAAVLVAGSVARADEMDKETKGKASGAVAAKAVLPAGSELDKESPDQSHGWRHRGWGVSYYGGGFGVSYYGGGFYRPYGYSVGYYPSYSVGYYPSYSVGYYPAYRSYYRGCW